MQRTGTGDAFEFIRFNAGQTEPFPDSFRMPDNPPTYPVQSLSLPIVTKRLGRRDESWLIQTAVNLRIVESHFDWPAKAAVVAIVSADTWPLGEHDGFNG